MRIATEPLDPAEPGDPLYSVTLVDRPHTTAPEETVAHLGDFAASDVFAAARLAEAADRLGMGPRAAIGTLARTGHGRLLVALVAEVLELVEAP